jgi:uncharacterized protein (UPF0305 family)
MISLRRVAANKTVDQILSVFNKTIEDLKAVSVQNSNVIDNSNKVIQEETDRIKTAKQEIVKADAVVAKLNSLIS